MAVTQEQAYNQIMAEMANQTSLAGIPKAQDTAVTFVSELTEGKAGIVRTLANATAFAISLQSQQNDRSRAVLEEIAASGIPSTDAWMAEKAKQFRWKYNPFGLNAYEVFVGEDNIPTWSAEALADDDALIVKFASAETNGGACLVKVNGAIDGLPTVLTPLQKDALIAYIDRIQPMGSQISATSRPPDWLSLNAKIYYNPLYAVDLGGVTIQEAVDAAIVSFLKTLPFNGVISRNRLEDAIRRVSGVVDCVLSQTKGRKSFEPFFATQAIIFTRQYKTFAGSCIYDSTNSTIEYLVA